MGARDVAAGDHEFAGAVMRNGRRDAQPQPVARMGPRLGEPAQRRDDGIGAAHAQLRGVVAGIVGQRVDQARHRLVEGEVGDHRRDDRAQPDLGIGAGDRLHALDGRRGEFEEQVVAGGGAFLDHLDRGDQRGEMLVVVAAMAADPRRRVEQEVELPEVADALGEAAMAVGVAVDQPGNDQPAARVDHLGIGVAHRAARHDVDDGVALDDDVARLAMGRRDGVHQSTCDHEHGAVFHSRSRVQRGKQRAGDVNGRLLPLSGGRQNESSMQ